MTKLWRFVHRYRISYHHISVTHTCGQIVSARGQTLYLCKVLSIRDDKRPREKGLEQFTASTGTATSVVMDVDCIVVFGD